ncbi:MAG TPA: adenylosuccinate lyase [Steroidobacteraceae bacterium]|nr:adenylosuccinate lyase [Steroidobacteraceae bacterium]
MAPRRATGVLAGAPDVAATVCGMISNRNILTPAPRMPTSGIDALSPIDGRYRAAAEPLRALLSEAGLIRERIRIEAQWFAYLSASLPELVGSGISPVVRRRAEELARNPRADAPAAVKRIEARINHDVKAVEYYVREQLADAGAAPASLELVHFGCTSEDVNNLSYARLLGAARLQLLESLAQVAGELASLARRYADLPMLARTHGQPASPTTLGKELANIVARLARAQRRLAAVEILGKWNGAVGNFNAHTATLPGVDWPRLARGFVESLGLAYNAYTTQIEPHDWIAEYCDAVAAANVILIDWCRDAWGYISLGYLRQRAVAGEVGSSTMPHKVNPIDFENAEGNLGVANALLRHFSEKLPLSRWQRDLTDSTVLRNLGVALAHSLIAWRASLRGLGKVEADPPRIAADIDGAWEVLGEAYQTALRAAGVPDGYEMLKSLTRGRMVQPETLAALIDSLPLAEHSKIALRGLRPPDYVGLAGQLAREATGTGPAPE